LRLVASGGCQTAAVEQPDFHPSWPEPARSLIRGAIERHGGWSLWQRLESVSVSLIDLSGALPSLKGHGRSFVMPGTVTIYPWRWRSEFSDDGQARAVFERGHVQVLGPGGEVLQDSLDHRATFAGLRKLRRWTMADACYFFGYAFASYAALPFILPGLIYRGQGAARWNAQRLRGVQVQFPPGAHVHSLRQGIFFDDSGLLRRMDYVADVAGWWARGAHGCDEHATVDGFPFPLRRTVVLRLGGWPLTPMVALAARFERLVVRTSVSSHGDMLPG
jgi:hypothetical protein